MSEFKGCDGSYPKVSSNYVAMSGVQFALFAATILVFTFTLLLSLPMKRRMKVFIRRKFGPSLVITK